MGVSSSGVSQGGGKAGMNMETMLAVALDPKKTAQRLAELTEAEAEHLKAAEKHGKADQIDSLLSEAKQERAKARTAVANANKRAATIEAKAETQAQETLAAAKEQIAKERTSIKQAQDRLKVREEAVREKERNIDPLYADAAAVKREAETMRDQAGRTKSSYEGRIRKLKAALKEANL